MSWCVVRDRQHREGPASFAGATQVGIFSEQVWGVSDERHQLALSTRQRDDFTALLTEDVRWGGGRGGHECTNRTQAGDHYAGLMAAGVTLHIVTVRADIAPDGSVVTATLRIDSPDPDRYRPEMNVRLTLRGGLINDITELDASPILELLYIDNCPHHAAFMPHLQQLLAGVSIHSPITLVRIESDEQAIAARFLGSPTLRVNGIDVDPTAPDRDTYGLQCRLYSTPEGPVGSPPDRWIIDALIDNPVWDAAVSAIHAGKVSSLRRILADHPDLASTRSVRNEGRTLLHTATDWPGHLPNVAQTIAALVQAGADPDTPRIGECPETPLHWAASSGDIDALDALLDAGADINVPGAVIAGGTPLADATAFGEWAAARRLVERGARTNLFEAAALGLIDQVESALAADQQTIETITSSFWGACHGGQVETAELLLNQGADINWIGYDTLTPLDAARRANATRLVAWLEKQGAQTNQAL